MQTAQTKLKEHFENTLNLTERKKKKKISLDIYTGMDWVMR